VDLPKES